MVWQVAAYQVDRVYATQVGPPAFFWMQRRLLVDLTSIYGRYFAPIAAIHTAPKAAAMLQLPDIAVSSEGGDITLSAMDKKNDTANNFNLKVGSSDKTFVFHFKTEHLKMLPGDYDVAISSKLISNFKHKSKSIQYWVALENTSKYTG